MYNIIFAVKSIEKFIDEIEAKIEEKEWGPTAEKLKVFGKKEATVPSALWGPFPQICTMRQGGDN